MRDVPWNHNLESTPMLKDQRDRRPHQLIYGWVYPPTTSSLVLIMARLFKWSIYSVHISPICRLHIRSGDVMFELCPSPCQHDIRVPTIMQLIGVPSFWGSTLSTSMIVSKRVQRNVKPVSTHVTQVINGHFPFSKVPFGPFAGLATKSQTGFLSFQGCAIF